MKKLALITITLIFIYCIIPETAFAEESDFNAIISTLIDALDGDELNKSLDEIWSQNDLEGETFKERLLSIINGDLSSDYGSILSMILGTVFTGIKKLIPTLLIVCAIALLYSFVKTLNPDFLSESTDKILYFTCYAAIIGLLIYKTFDIANGCFNAMKTYASQMDVVFPLILTVMSATGGTATASVYQPAVAFLSTGITNIITSVVMPLIYFLLLFISVSGLSQSIKAGKFTGFISSVIKWILGICLTVFTMFISVQGLAAGAFDGVTLRVTKYAIGNSVPIVGGFLKDGAELFIASGVLIKNALGLCGLILIISVFVPPLIQLISFSLFLKLAAGVIEPFADSRMSEYMYSLAKNLNYVLASLLVVGFMYVITVVLVLYSGGYFI